MNDKKQIAICTCGHPLIWTFAFNYAEYWCPDCNSNFGMLGVRKINSSPDLEFDLILAKARTKKYLDARSTLICQAKKINGKFINRVDFPKSMIDRANKIINNYKSINENHE